MDYILIAAFLVYYAMYRCVVKYDLRPVTASLVAVGVPYVLKVITAVSFANAHGLPVVEQAFTLASVTTVLLQFILAFVFFRKIQNEEGIAASLGWALVGVLVVVFAVPPLIEGLIR